MNPAFVFIFAISLLAAWWLGFATGGDKEGDFWPNGPSVLLNVGCILVAVITLVTLLTNSINHAP